MSILKDMISEPECGFSMFEKISDIVPSLQKLIGIPHDPIYHEEGDPWIHTRMVCDQLSKSEEYINMSTEDRTVSFLSAVFHDVGKAITFKILDNNRVSSSGHSRVGSLIAREILWKDGFDPVLREKICSAILYHQIPFYLNEKEWFDIKKNIICFSLSCGNNILYALSKADIKGRKVNDNRSLDNIFYNIDLLKLYSSEYNCFDKKFEYFDGYTLKRFISKPDSIDPKYGIYHNDFPSAILMSGLPGSGKSTWINNNIDINQYSIVSLDDIRELLDVSPEENQGEVIQFAKQKLKEILRSKKNVVFDSTNITRNIREPILDLISNYGYETKIVSMECEYNEIFSRFKIRDRFVPQNVMEKLIRKWEFPYFWEADNFEHDISTKIKNCLAFS